VSDLIDELAAYHASKQEAAEGRERQVAEAREQRRQYDAVWDPVIRACRFDVSVDEAARNFLALGRLLKARGYDAYLPSIIAHRKEAMQRGDKWAPGELAVLELLRWAVAPKTSKAGMARAFRDVKVLRSGYGAGSISGKAVNVSQFFDIWHAHGGTLPKVKRPKPQEQPATPKLTKDGPWSQPDGPAQWAKKFNVSVSTVKRRFADGSIRVKKLSPKSYLVHVDDVPSVANGPR
jgi:hypothetical protein